MATNELKTILTGDISDLQAKLTKADQLLGQYSNNIKAVQNAIRKSVRDSQQYEREINDLNNALRQGTISEEKFERENRRLTDSFQKSQRETRDFQRELDRLEKEYKQVESAIDRTNRAQNDFPRATNRATQATGKLEKGTVNATAATTSFSRVIQDAPYGIQGVANNIQDLTSQFGYLQNKTGSARGAFKAMAKDLVGSGGVLLAVSLVTSLLVQYGDELLDLITPTNKLNKATREYLATANSEITTLNQLVDIATDENNTKKVRQKAINELNSKYPEYFSNLDLEKGKTDLVTSAVNKLSTALINQAKIKGVQDRIDEIFNERQEEGTTLLERRQTAYDDLIKKIRFLNAQKGLGINQQELNNALNNLDYTKLDEFIKVAQKGFLNSKEFNAGITGSFQNLLNKYEGATRAGKEFDDETQSLISSLLDLQTQLTKDYFENTPFEEGEEGAKDATDSVRELQKAVTDLQHNSEIVLDVKLSDKATEKDTPTFESPTITPEADLEAIDEFAQKIKDLEVTSSLATSAISASFQTMGSQITQALVYGNEQALKFKEVVQSMASAIIQSLVQMAAQWVISQLIESVVGQKKIAIERGKSTANAITIATNAAAAAGPLGVSLAPGLIASQIALVQGAFATAQTFATGGIVGGGSYVGDRIPIMANAGEMILNNRQQRSLFNMLDGANVAPSVSSQQVEVVGIIKGEDIVLSSDRYNRNRGRRN